MRPAPIRGMVCAALLLGLAACTDNNGNAISGAGPAAHPAMPSSKSPGPPPGPASQGHGTGMAPGYTPGGNVDGGQNPPAPNPPQR